MNRADFTFVATQAALAAGELLRRGFGTSYEIFHKPGQHNLVTTFDKKAEELIISFIHTHFPKHAILAEESGASQQSSDVTWIIDPLDGTVNFAHNIPHFSVSIAAAIGKEVVSGVVFQPMTGELFVAEKGKGAYLNGKPIRTTSRTTLEECLLATGFPYNVRANPEHCIDQFVKLAKQGIPIRRLGSAAIDLSYVAAGRFDAFWEVQLHPWDVAAGQLLVEEAGGKVTHYDGLPRDLFGTRHILASNGPLHPTMVKQLCA